MAGETTPARLPLRTLTGHADSVICLASSGSSNTLASGGEDGRLVLHDVRAPQAAAAAIVAAANAASSSSPPPAVAALCFDPLRPEILYAAAGTQLVALDLRALASSSTPGLPPPWRPLASSSRADAARDDVGALAATSAHGGLLAAADDAGDVAVFDLLASYSVGSAGGCGAATALKRRVLLRGAHGDSPACAAAFLQASSSTAAAPTVVLSGGCDSRVVLTDTGLPSSSSSSSAKRRAPRAVAAWRMGGEEAAAAAPAEGGPATASGATSSKPDEATTVGFGTVGGPRLCNPPFVLGLDVWIGGGGGGGGRCMAAAARGDGVVAIFDPLGAAKGGGASSVVLIDGAHRRAASCVRWLVASAVGQQQQQEQPLLLASGGDDGRAALWRWGGGAADLSAGRQPELAWEAAMPGKRRPAKVNAVCDVGDGGAGAGGGGGGLLAVADTTTGVKLFSVS